jgi:tetratricopeptide (TPR) repeat protein
MNMFSRSCTVWAILHTLACLVFIGCGPASEKPGPTAQETAKPEQGDQVDADTATPPIRRDQLLERADLFAEAEEYDKAAELLQQLLIVNPQDVEVLFRLASVTASTGNLADAIRFLDEVPADHPDAGLPALGQSADWCLQLERYDQAETRYLAILKQAPDTSMALRRIAELLNRQGRRHEAAEHIRQLCRQGDFRQDELQALIVLSDAMISNPDDTGPTAVDYSPIGASGQARILFTERRYGEAAEVLRETVDKGGAPPSVVAFYGRCVAEAQDDPEFLRWLGKTDAAVREFSEYWAAVGAYLATSQQHEAATRALLEALDRDPTDFMSINRVHHMLTLLEKPAEAEKWKKRWTAYHQALLASNGISDSETPNVAAMDELASQLNAIGRKLEAVLWKSLESHYRQHPQEILNHWNRERQQLVASDSGFPDRTERICGFRLDEYPVPNFKNLASSAATPTQKPKVWTDEQPISLANVAEQIGLTHAYRIAPEDRESGFAMYHQAGGGVAVLDYDCDGNPDLYFAQGAADPPEFIAQQSNVLYRNEGGRVVDVTDRAEAEEYRYTIGCTAGDWNQDGFPDLITTNIGFNRLFINNGDGTFAARNLEGSDDMDRMPSSVAIADLNGDHLPDIFELNYIQDPQIAKLPERDKSGNVIEAVGPGDFASAMDRIGINDGSGGVSFKPISNLPSEAHKGLGVVIADFDNKPGNDVFVGNDKSANQLWVRDPDSGAWSDIAIINGSAFSSGGGATASMGIAAGDFDQTGTLDLHVSNFQNESACLYLSQDGVFRDRAVQYKLDVPSRAALGFGSQAIDFDNNTMLDLVVANGHIDNYLTMSGPFKQLSQLFINLGDRFQVAEVDDASGYGQTPHLGRALARLDFNRDGKNDMVITHLSEASALLLNQTQTSNHWMQLQLVGVRSERDAIGAKIKVKLGDRSLWEWVIGGDGYFCRNEAVVSFGLGDAARVDELSIDWPSGVSQTITNVAVDQRILIVEDDAQPFSLSE